MTVVDTALGKLRGVNRGAVTAWLGVPYARPPIGELRFRAPQPVTPWPGVRDAIEFSRAAPQPVTEGPITEPMVTKLGTSEDCLYVNIWSPTADGARRPVMVWIHGGACMMGTGATYDGAELAAMGDVVIVTINYRLGVLGYVAFGGLFGDSRFDDNLGLRDQRAALEWVRDHIAAFGGDPERVTVAGESAGALAVTLLMLNERPLFRAAIAQSGMVTLGTGHERGLAHAKLYADALDVTTNSAERLRDVPVERLLDVHQAIMRAHPGTVTTRPYLDGNTLPATPAELFTRPLANVPLLLGSNRDEATLFAFVKLMPTEPAEVEVLVRQRVPAELADRVLAAYSRDRAGALALGRDAVFTMPMIHFAERPRQAPTWMYRFDWPTPAFGGVLGAMHALELFLMWQNMERRGVQLVLGGPPSPEVRALADRMKRTWLAFVRDADPGADWPRYDTRTRTTRLFNVEDSIVDDPEGDRRRAWDGIDTID